MNYKEISTKEFPFEGEFFLSRNKRFQELIFFVHFYEGSKKQLLRHIRLVNSLGFDAFAFNLQGTITDAISLRPMLSRQGTFGVKHAYADQIETLLNLIPGQKIIFSFSNPSASAIEAMARRFCSDTIALVCDSGPTSKFIPSALKLLTQKHPKLPLPLRMSLAPAFSLAWSPYLHKDLKKDLDKFPSSFPVLSIRGWKDALIPPSDIDGVFEGHSQISWTKLSLPEAEHLTGLRDFKEEYSPMVSKFLLSIGSPVSEVNSTEPATADSSN